AIRTARRAIHRWSTAGTASASCSPTGTIAVITSRSTLAACATCRLQDERRTGRLAKRHRLSPDLFSGGWFSALASIIVIDLILAGDNALVIGLAARHVPRDMQKRVILWGTAGAIVVRALLTAIVVWLLKIPGFLLAGGLALVYIGWKLTRDAGGDTEIAAKSTVRGAVQTIVIADAVMGVDNVLAVGGAAHGSLLLVLIGLAVSIPIVIWGSTLVLKWVVRYPAILWLRAAVLGWTAAKMLASEPLLGGFLR